jgi:hypothetical protein
MMPNVMIYHERIHNGQGVLMARGGITVIVDFDAAVGGAARCTHRDNYSKRIGVSIATGRINRGYRGVVTARDELLVCNGVAVVVPSIRNGERPVLLANVEDVVRKMSFQHERKLAWTREHGGSHV